MKKLISVLTALSLLLLAGCGSSVNPQAKKYYNAGIDALSENNYTNAIANFTEALEISPTYADAYLYRGDAYVMAAEETAKLADADSLTVYSHLVNAEIDYRNALNNDEKLAVSVSDKQLRVDELKPKLVSYNSVLPNAQTTFQSTFEMGHFLNNSFHSVSVHPGTISLSISESPIQLTAKDKLEAIVEIDESLSNWLSLHKDYKEITAVLGATTAWIIPHDIPNNSYTGIVVNYHFSYIDSFTNLSIELTAQPSWAISTLNIDGQDTDILIIWSDFYGYGSSGESSNVTATLTMLVPPDYDLGTFCIGTNRYSDDVTLMSSEFCSITSNSGAIDTYFVEIEDTN